MNNSAAPSPREQLHPQSTQGGRSSRTAGWLTSPAAVAIIAAIAIILGATTLFPPSASSAFGIAANSAPADSGASHSASSPAGQSADGDAPVIAASTEILASITSAVVGEHARVLTIIPPQADVHEYELSLGGLRDVHRADLIVANGLLLEPGSVTDAIQAAADYGTEVVELGDEVTQYGGALIPLVERSDLDTPWLGIRMAGQCEDQNIHAATIHVDLKQAPGEVNIFTTGTFGEPNILFSSTRPQADMVVPLGAHTHMTWAFGAPGEYHIALSASACPNAAPIVHDLVVEVGQLPEGIGQDSAKPAGTPENPYILMKGHADVTFDVSQNRSIIRGESLPGATPTKPGEAEHALVFVPPQALHMVPREPEYRFLGKPDQPVYLLQQAVAGAHLHGDMDPHIWLDPTNAQAMALAIADHACGLVDAQVCSGFRGNAAQFSAAITAAQQEVTAKLTPLPNAAKQLITTHDGAGYFAQAFGLTIAGTVAASPATEPTPRDIALIARAVSELHIPAVYMDPLSSGHNTVLERAAERGGMKTCVLYTDSFAGVVTNLPDLYRANAEQIADCGAASLTKS